MFKFISLAVAVLSLVAPAEPKYKDTYIDEEIQGYVIEISELYDVGVIDLYTDADFNSISEEQRKLYMADNIHPTKAGYLEWWTPKIEAYIVDYLSR